MEGCTLMQQDIDIEHAERLSSLEEFARTSKEDRSAIRADVREMREEFGELKETLVSELSSIKQQLATYRGFWGGIMLVFSAVVTFLSIAGGWIAKKIGLE